MKMALLLVLQSLVESGYQYFARGEFGEARKHLERAVAAQPKSFEARFLLGAALVELGDPAAAIVQLRQAHLLNPEHADARKLLAAQYMAARRYGQAAALVDPPSDEETYLLAIESRHRAGDGARAFELAQQAAGKFPKSGQIAAWLGFQLQFAGRYEEAKARLRRAMELEPELPLAYQTMGDVLLKEENFAEAAQWLQRAAEKMPGDVETLLSLSRALTETGGVQRAIDLLRAAPRDARVHLRLSRLYFLLGDEARARDEAARSIEMREKDLLVSRP